MAFLTPAQLAKAQAEAEGFQNGPQPALNPVNINTQDKLGNATAPTTTGAPYYPSQETPNLQLSTRDMASELANNFVTLDAVLAVVPILQAKLDVLDTTAPHTLAYTATVTTMFCLSLFMESEGDGLVTDTLVATIAFTDPSSPADAHSFSCVLHGGPGENIVMETYPVLCEATTVITCTTAFGAGVFTYDIGVRLVQMP